MLSSFHLNALLFPSSQEIFRETTGYSQFKQRLRQACKGAFRQLSDPVAGKIPEKTDKKFIKAICQDEYVNHSSI